jgi:hypothetical protein
LPVSFSVNGEAGAECTLAGEYVGWPVDFHTFGGTSYALEVKPQLSADASLKQKIYLGADITVVGIKVTDFEAGGGPYIKLNGTVGADVLYDSSKTPPLSVTANVSASGEIGIFAEVTGSVYNGKWDVTILSKEFPLLTLDAQNGWSSPFIHKAIM